MKYIAIVSLCTLLAFSGVLSSCKSDTSSAPAEFIADNTTFANSGTWAVTSTTKGPDPALGAMAHGGNDSTVTRVVHIKDNQARVSGKFPIGTLIIKHSTSPSGMNAITAMAKRGNGFNSAGNDWEFFMLNPDGSIATDPTTKTPMRGANLMDGMCMGCHSGASAKDFVFTAK